MNTRPKTYRKHARVIWTHSAGQGGPNFPPFWCSSAALSKSMKVKFHASFYFSQLTLLAYQLKRLTVDFFKHMHHSRKLG